MDMEIRQVIDMILRGREYVFSVLHSILGAEPTRELLEAVSRKESIESVLLLAGEKPEASPTASEPSEKAAEACGKLAEAPERLAEILEACREVSPEELEEMRLEYTRLFLGPEKLIAPPWESVYLNTERALFQESTLEVRNWYRRYGYLPARYPRIADDHISLMTHFLALTTRQARKHLEENEAEKCRKTLEDQRGFEESHLLNWLDAYAADIQKSSTRKLYPGLVAAAADFIKYDRTILEELLERI